MRSIQIHRDTVGEREVSTIWWENDETGYYETAVREVNGSYSVHEWGGTLPIEAEAFHATMVIMCDKAQHYEER
jgi:hypothetical protein